MMDWNTYSAFPFQLMASTCIGTYSSKNFHDFSSGRKLPTYKKTSTSAYRCSPLPPGRWKIPQIGAPLHLLGQRVVASMATLGPSRRRTSSGFHQRMACRLLNWGRMVVSVVISESWWSVSSPKDIGLWEPASFSWPYLISWPVNEGYQLYLQVLGLILQVAVDKVSTKKTSMQKCWLARDWWSFPPEGRSDIKNDSMRPDMLLCLFIRHVSPLKKGHHSCCWGWQSFSEWWFTNTPRRRWSLTKSFITNIFIIHHFHHIHDHIDPNLFLP